jgi:hypothetical protein
VFGAAAVILILIILPHHHASASMVFTSTVNNTGFFGGKTSGFGFIFVVLPIGALLTQYTITGYDASAHLSEETHSAANSAAKGMWRSIFYSAIGGWLLLLAFLFAVQDEAKVTAAGGGVAVIFAQALTSAVGWDGPAHLHHGPVLLHHGLHDQLLPHALRLQPRRRRPGHKSLVAAQRPAGAGGRGHPHRRHRHHPHRAGPHQGRHRRCPVPIAFYAVVSIGVIGLYWCFAIPIWHRLAMGDRFKAGDWNLGPSTSAVRGRPDRRRPGHVMAFMPTSNLGVPWTTGFS